ncbi:MAG: glutamate--tRNA ligase [Alphaproteobacteria bacterium]|nr:glutamate--tRNA ligase [Alphaproteobacteria bacterium]MBP7759785.1 glutamate--tRNA ligase [Alphaproteobacteria bacterium]MBP7763107.1 glutamate--tRNA ligase [Alphaproteobacteria bacterium]
MTIRVRFAPSPTGMLHIGNARTALITWLYARSRNGHFLLRIDDTDLERSKKEYEDAIEDGLKWLGMNWDEKTRQQDRLDYYNVKIEQLKASGRLYPCYETSEELELKRKSQLARKLPPLYDREALKLTDEQKKAFEAQGRKPHWRFKMNHAPIRWDDEVRGPVHFEGADMSDPVLIREDGSPLYHLCSVIDDIDYQMTHIVRGEDHVTNTAMHVQMFEALGAKPPSFAHLPLLSDAHGGKLSKRLGALNLKELRDQEGLEPMAVVSLLARLGTSDPIEPFTEMKDVIGHFDIAKFGRGTPKFDQEELTRLNAKILHHMSYTQIKPRLTQIGLTEMSESFWEIVRPNLEKLEDAKEWWRVANGPVEPVIEDQAFITEAAKLLPATPWTRDTWGVWVDAVKIQTGRKGKQLFMPLRKALTGMEHGPELADLLLLIGPEKTRKRLGA